jgi:ABC-type multidrug transport system ATPase subunit
MNAVEARELVRQYRPGRGVCGVNFSVKPGECFAVLGRNGSGKSTLARLILGLEKPDSGRLSILGCPKKGGRTRSSLSGIGAVLDSSVHWEELSGLENAYFAARMYGMGHEEAERRLQDLFGLAGLGDRAEEPVRSYSFGMRRKLSLIQALCHDPELLVLDEPTIGVDAHFLLILAEILRSRSGMGRATWISGNDAGWIGSVAHRAAFLDSGRIAAVGTVEDLIREVSAFQVVVTRLSKPAPIPCPERKGIRSFEQSGETIRIILDLEPMLVAEVMNWIVAHGGEIGSLEVRKSTLKDVFLYKTGRALDA